MDDLRGKYRVPYRDEELQVGSNSAVLTQTFVAESLRREYLEDDGLRGFRGAVNAILFSLAIWAALGLVLFTLF